MTLKCSLSLFLSVFVVIQALGVAQDGTIVLKASRILDGRGGIFTDTNIVVRDGRIAEVTPSPRTESSLTYDLEGLTVLPGLIDTHVHIGWHFDANGTTHSRAVEETSEQAMLYGVENAYLTLMGGVTTVQSVGSPSDADLRDWVARGTIPGPRILTSLRSVTARTGEPAEMRAFVRTQAAEGADVIKIFASASIRDGGAPTLSFEQLEAVCGEARAQGLRTLVHAHGPESAQRAVPSVLKVFQEALTLPDLKVVFGTDAVAGAHGRNSQEIEYRVRAGGQRAADAIVSATSLAAQSIGLGDEIGAVAPGMAADLIALDGNPIDDISALRRVMFVMKGGTVYKFMPVARDRQ